jgi:hypothetical protein
MMGPRILSESPILPDVITIEDDEDKENIVGGIEYEVDAESYLWKSELKPFNASTNVISKRQQYKSSSSVLHAALDAVNKKKKLQKPIIKKPVKDLTEEELRKELKELDARSEEIQKALKAFEKKNEPEEIMEIVSPGTSSVTERSHIDKQQHQLRTPQTPASVKKTSRLGPNKSFSSRLRNSTTTKTSQNAISPRRRMSMKSPGKSMGQENQQLLLSQMDDDGCLVQQIYSNDESVEEAEQKSILAAVERENLDTIIADIPKILVIPYSKDYDPSKTVPPHRVSFLIKEMQEQFRDLYFQPDFPENNVKVPIMKEFNRNNFYLHDIPAEKIPSLKEQIESLGGLITNSLFNATKVIFYPTGKPMTQERLFTFLTAAIGGRYLLPANYVIESNDTKKFLNPNDYCNYEYYERAFDLDDSALAAINISNFYRKYFTQNRYPRFYRHNVLFAVPKDQERDVKLFLQILGAYVQPYYDNKKFLKNPLYTLCVSDGRIKLSKEAKLIPRATPSKIREILWKTRDKFLNIKI